MEVALQDDPAFLTPAYFGVGRALDLASQLETSRIRVNVIWSRVVRSAKAKKKPKHLAYDWSAYDALVNAVKPRGIRVQMTLTGSAPAWATGNKKVGNYKPKPALFTDFVKQTAKHFAGLVDRYSIWNEPNYVGWIAPLKSGPSIYRSLFINGYNAIKSVDPSAKVLIGETSAYSLPRRATAPIKFLRAVANSGHLTADGYAHHPYDFRHSINYNYPGKDNATLKTIGNLTGALDQLAASNRLTTPAGKPLDLWFTEWGYMVKGVRYGLSESTRAKYLTQGFDMAVANPRVREMLQYLLVKPKKGYGFFDMSLVSRKGSQGAAFKALSKWAKNAVAAGKIAKPGSAPAY
jgi:hypothetical protein